MQQIVQASEEMARLASNLQQLVAMFKIGDAATGSVVSSVAGPQTSEQERPALTVAGE